MKAWAGIGGTHELDSPLLIYAFDVRSLSEELVVADLDWTAPTVRTVVFSGLVSE
jgi:hypothetical protein